MGRADAQARLPRHVAVVEEVFAVARAGVGQEERKLHAAAHEQFAAAAHAAQVEVEIDGHGEVVGGEFVASRAVVGVVDVSLLLFELCVVLVAQARFEVDGLAGVAQLDEGAAGERHHVFVEVDAQLEAARQALVPPAPVGPAAAASVDGAALAAQGGQARVDAALCGVGGCHGAAGGHFALGGEGVSLSRRSRAMASRASAAWRPRGWPAM